MTGEPDDAEPLVRVEVTGVPQATYRIYPLADHVADKLFAIVERHLRTAGPAIASTRYRDIADLVIIARREELDAAALRLALAAQAKRRHLLPRQVRTPDDVAWRAGYARVARDVPALEERDLEAAIATVSRFLDPVLQGTARGRWAPARQAWVGE